MSDDGFEPDHWGRVLTLVLVAMAVIAALYLLLGRGATKPEDAHGGARRWTDSLGIRVTGIVCNGSTCTIAPEQGAPFKAYCNASECTLAGERQ